MPMEFQGRAHRLTERSIESAARRLACQSAALRAVIAVESKGGFQADGRPKILFERHYFHRLTGGMFAHSHPDICHPRWGGYGPSALQYDRLHRAITLNRDAALRSASWGAFQIMGDNCMFAGFRHVEDFVIAMVESEDRQLDAFVAFVMAKRLDDELRRLDWAGFARRYNGPAYRKNRYDEKLAASYAKQIPAIGHDGGQMPVLRIGDSGDAVRRLQTLLGLNGDGVFGSVTRQTLIAFQKAHGLYADGVAGAASWAALDSMNNR